MGLVWNTGAYLYHCAQNLTFTLHKGTHSLSLVPGTTLRSSGPYGHNEIKEIFMSQKMSCEPREP